MDSDRVDFEFDGPVEPLEPLDVEGFEPPAPPAPKRRRQPRPSSSLPDSDRQTLYALAALMVAGIGIERLLLLLFMPGGKVVGLAVMSTVFILTSVGGLVAGALVMQRSMRR